MEKQVVKLKMGKPKKQEMLRVAAYARVSTEKDAMLKSLSAQVCYYSNYIQNHPGWIFCGVYADEGISGTKVDRENFEKLMAACRNGEIDLVITKSISRFARNTIKLLEEVRSLKEIGVAVYFEEENINTLSGEGELLLTILAAVAEEQSVSASENVKWRYKKDFEKGILPACIKTIYGYKRNEQGELIVIPEEAKLVRRMFMLFLEGNGVHKIASILNDEGARNRKGECWAYNSVRYILVNPTYIGDLCLQKYFVKDPITKKRKMNQGELDQYYVDENHEAIIDRQTFEMVQQLFSERAERFYSETKVKRSELTSKIECAKCGKNFRKKVCRKKQIWMCSTFDRFGKQACAAKQIPEIVLKQKITEVLNLKEYDAEEFNKKIEKIKAYDSNVLVFVFKNGKEVTKTWENLSRSDSWTDEMKEKARQRNLRRKKNGSETNKSDSGNDRPDYQGTCI